MAYGRPGPPSTIADVTLLWLSLAVAIVLPVCGTVVVVRRAIALWRDLKRAGRALAEALDGVGARLERTSAAAEGLAAVSARPEPGLERLRISLARFAVLRAAAPDVRDSAGRAAAVYPRK